MSGPRVIVALDFPRPDEALDFVAKLDSGACRVKIGKELFSAGGPRLVEAIVSKGFEVFLDLKFHDIPNTVASACRAVGSLGVWMVDVHALGGRAMMEAAANALANARVRPKIIAVTVLTSIGAEEMREVGIAGTLAQAVDRLARLARQSGMDGVVCSAQEAGVLRAACGVDFCLVTPGIRPANAAGDDQVRVMTPARAMQAGAHYLVIGRPITRAPDPLAALRSINAEIFGVQAAGQ